MNIVLLSGGSGKRLWPLSNDIQSKQFLKLLKNDSGEYESMVQRVLRQIRTAHPKAVISVACNVSQTDIISRQLGGVDIIAEPSRRDTFPAIVLAAAHLRYSKGLSDDDMFLVCPIDTFAQDEYFELFSDILSLIDSGRHTLGLLGAKPICPSEKYGYILHEGSEVTGFVEKPSLEKSTQLIADGALWNCGVFALKIGYILGIAAKYISFDSFDSLAEQYDKLPKNSFDYEVCEKEISIGCAVYDGFWKDLGTWNTLTEEMSANSVGDDVLISDSCENTHVLNMLSVPVIVQDVSDAVIVASHDGILVSSKGGSSHLKQLTDSVNTRPMYLQHEWGTYRVLERRQTDGAETVVKRLKIDAGRSFVIVGCNTQSAEVYVITAGKGILTKDGTDTVLTPGSIVDLSSGTGCTILAATDLELIGVQTG